MNDNCFVSSLFLSEILFYPFKYAKGFDYRMFDLVNAVKKLQISNYEKEVEEMKHMTRQEFVASIRR